MSAKDTNTDLGWMKVQKLANCEGTVQGMLKIWNDITGVEERSVPLLLLLLLHTTTYYYYDDDYYY